VRTFATTRAQRHGDLHGGAADAAAGAVHEQQVAHAQSALHRNRIEGGQERLRCRCRRGAVQRVGHRGQLALGGDDARRQATAADQPEGAVADLEGRHRVADRDHRTGHLQAGDVLGPAGRHRMLALALQHVGRVDAGERRRDHDLESVRLRIRSLLDRHHLAAAHAAIDDAPHGVAPGG
jgi:hypothetical protein